MTRIDDELAWPGSGRAVPKSVSSNEIKNSARQEPSEKMHKPIKYVEKAATVAAKRRAKTLRACPCPMLRKAER